MQSNVDKTRMWADAQRDGRPATAQVPCSNAANIERKTWTQSEFCSWQNSIRGKCLRKCIYNVPSQVRAGSSYLDMSRAARTWSQTGSKPNSITLSWSQTWSQTCSELEFGLSRTI